MLGSLDEAAEFIASSRREQEEEQLAGGNDAVHEEGVDNATRKRGKGSLKGVKRGPYKKRKLASTTTTTTTTTMRKDDENETRSENEKKKKRSLKTLEERRERRKRMNASIDAKLERMRQRKLLEPKKVMSAYKAFSEHDPQAKLCRRENPLLSNPEKYSKLRELWHVASDEQRAEAEVHVNRDELRYQREMQTYKYKRAFVQISEALLRGEREAAEAPKPRKGYFLFESSERAMSETVKHSKDLSIKWKAMTQEERDTFNADFTTQQHLYNSMLPIFEKKRRLLKEEDEDEDEDRVGEENDPQKENQVEKQQQIGIETKKAKSGMSERANAELRARFERARGLEFLCDVKYTLPSLGLDESDKGKRRKYKDAMEKETGIVNLDRMKIVPKARSEFGQEILKKEIDDLSVTPSMRALSGKCNLDASSLAKIVVLGKKGSVIDFDKLKSFIETSENNEKLDAAYEKYVKYNPPDWASFKEELKL